MDAEHSGSVRLPTADPEAHPALARTLANPVIRLIVGFLAAAVAAYVSVQVTRIDGRLEAVENRSDAHHKDLVELRIWKAEHMAEHRAHRHAEADRIRRWEDATERAEKRREAAYKEWRAGTTPD